MLLLTFWCYACFHASRKPLSVVKSVLTGESNSTTLTYWASYDTGPLDPGGLLPCTSLLMQHPLNAVHLHASFEEAAVCPSPLCCSSVPASPQHEHAP